MYQEMVSDQLSWHSNEEKGVKTCAARLRYSIVLPTNNICLSYKMRHAADANLDETRLLPRPKRHKACDRTY